MKHVAAFLRTALEQVLGKYWAHVVLVLYTGKRQSRTWTAYTRTGKVVILDGDRVVRVIDPHKRYKR